MEKVVDYLIVGQGLAGSVLSFLLLEKGKSLLVYDQNDPTSSSRVAAGLYNPVTGRKMVKTWNADRLFPEIEGFYTRLEKWTKRSFLKPIGIYRPFLNPQEQNEWQARAIDPSFQPFIGDIHSKEVYEEVHNEDGGLALQPAGFVDLPVLLDGVAAQLESKDQLRKEGFQVEELNLSGQQVEYRGIKANKVVFCTGVNATSYFDWLPFRLVKGEILDVSVHLQLETIVNRGVFLIPKGNNKFRLGSTYNNHDLTTEVTQKGKKYLSDKFRDLFKVGMEIEGGKAGIRPATADRRPFIGFHPNQPSLGILNGFGTKGVSLLPYYATQFFRHAEYGEEIDPEVNISRYFSLI